jgi:hypothetical protein
MSVRDGYRGDEGDGADVPRDMNEQFIDDLLAGRIPEDATAWEDVAAAVAAYRSSVEDVEVPASVRDAIVTASAEEARAAAADPVLLPSRRARRRPGLVPRLATRVAGGTLVFFTLASGAAAAGILPDPVQTVFATAYRVIGVDLPDPSVTTQAVPPPQIAPDSTTTSTTTVPDASTTTEGDQVVVGSLTPPPPSITVSLTPEADEIPETRGRVGFTVDIRNESSQRVTIASLEHSMFGDLTGEPSGDLKATSCDVAGAEIAGGERFTCRFEAKIKGRAGEAPHEASVDVGVVDGWSRSAQGSAGAVVAFADVLPSADVVVVPAVEVVAEPGGSVEFTLTVTNTSAERVTVVSLSGPTVGDLFASDNPDVTDNSCLSLPQKLARGEEVSCTFVAFVGGDVTAGPSQVPLELGLEDRQGNLVTEVAEASLTATDTLPDLAITVSRSTLAVSPSAPSATFTVTLSNGTGEPVTISELTDDVFGSLLEANAALSDNTCAAMSRVVPGNAEAECSFTAAPVVTLGGEPFTTTVRAAVSDNEANGATADAATSVAGTTDGTIVSSSVFGDANRNGVRDPDESGLPGVLVQVTAPDVGSMTVTTDADGHWSVLVPPGLVSHAVVVKSVDPVLVPTTPSGLRTVRIEAGMQIASAPRGYWYPPEVVEGVVEFDVDADGASGPAVGVPGVIVQLTDVAGTVIDSTVTDGAGAFRFEDMGAGAFAVVVVPESFPAGMVGSHESDGILDSAVGVTVPAHETVGGVVFGIRATGTLTQGAAPPGATAVLTWFGFDGNPGTGDEATYRTVVGADGVYTFVNIPRGSFDLSFE